jgi:hypothetical protein
MALPTIGWRAGADGVDAGADGVEAGAPARTTPPVFGAAGRGFEGAPFTSFGGAAGAFFLTESLPDTRRDPSRSEKGINIDCAG